MITEKILDFFFSIVTGVLSWLPDVSWNFSIDDTSSFLSYINMVCYLLPIRTIIAIAVLIFEIAMFRAFIALIHLVTDLIPFY